MGKKDIILNFLPIAMGGGLQNSLSFIKTLANDRKWKDSCAALVREGTRLHKLCKEVDVETVVVPNSNLGRLSFEVSCRLIFLHGQLCFTLFGPVMLRSTGYLLNVNGCAYSNLFYPEISFWGFLPSFQRVRKEAIDLARKLMTQKADYWIFETEALRKRAIELCGFPEDRVSVVQMAASNLVSKDRVDISQSEFLNKRIPKAYRILYLSGAHPNKRLHLLPEIAKEMVRSGFNDFCFVTTMDEASLYARRVIADFVAKGVGAHLVNLGPVPSEQVSTVIEVCDVMCTFSVLESFSNNFVEAWRMEKPLITTDADWSRDSCGDAALYVDPAQTAQTASELISLAKNELEQFRYIEEGKIQLARYHTPESKLDDYFDVISRAKQMGPLPSKLRKKIHWS